MSTPSTLTLASTPQDAAALADAEAHTARLAGALDGHVTSLLAAVDDCGAPAIARLRTRLADFCDRELLPYAAAQEATLYPAAHRSPEGRLLVESLVAEGRRFAALVDSLRAAAAPTGAAADARALQVLFEEHTAKVNGVVLPLLAVASGVDLAALLAELHEDAVGGCYGGGGGGGCGGQCDCAG